MKKTIFSFFGLWSCIVAATVLSLTGCETIKKVYNAGTITVSEQTSNELIVKVEQATKIALDSVDTFVRLNYEHQAAYAKISPKIHEFSVWLRQPIPDPEVLPGDPPSKSIQRGLGIIKTARIATKTFKANRTLTNEANLRTALKTVHVLIDDVKKYTAMTLTDK